MLEINKIHQGDCLDLMKLIPDKSIDLIFADLPYSTTNCKWDSAIPLNKYIFNNKGKIVYEDEFILTDVKNGISYETSKKMFDILSKDGLWQHYERIIKDNGAILLFAQTPFDKVLGSSNLKLLRYEWIWEKTQATGHLNAKEMPMKAHENILVFYKKLPTYNPIMTEGHIRKVSKAKNRAACIERRNDTDNIYNNEYSDRVSDYDSTIRYPRSVVKFPTDKQKSTLHKTQKPVELVKYFIKTYSNEGDLVLDNTSGSGTLGVACIETNRNFILIEKEAEFVEISNKRIENHHK